MKMSEEERKLDEKWKAERIPQHIRYKRIRQARNAKQRCNHCMSVFDEKLDKCPVCGRDDALMYPFEEVQLIARKEG